MNLALEPATERWIVEEAKQAGLSPEQLIADRLHKQYALIRQSAVLPDEEFYLLHKINEGFSTEFWTRYRMLIVQRDEGTLTEPEHHELIACSDQVEQKDAERIPYLLALAERRNISLSELVAQLGLRPASVTQ